MNKTLTYLSLIIALLIGSTVKTYSQDTANAVEYLDNLSGTANSIKGNTWKYIRLLAKSKNMKKVDKQRDKLLTAISDTKASIQKITPFENDPELQNAYVEYFDLQYKVLREDYDEIIKMDEIKEQSYDALEAYILIQEAANEKLANASDKLSEAEKKFAEAHNIRLSHEKDKTTLKIENASNALSYHNKLYLIVMKCNMQEAYALEALTSNDINAIQQNMNALQSYAEESEEKLKDIPLYKGYSNLKNTTSKLVKFYLREATKDAPKLIDFYLEQEEFAKTNKAFEKTPKKKLKKKDVDDYNKAVNKFNKLSNNFNQVNEKLYNERTRLLQSLEKETDKFMNKFVD